MQERTKGIWCMLFSALSFTFMNVFVRLAGDIPSMQKSLFRNLISFAVALFLILREKTPWQIPRHQWKHLFSRSFFGTIGILCNFYSVDHMLLSDATMLNKMSPFFTIVFSIWLLKERATPTQLLLSCTALGGCMFILKPSLTGLISPVAAVAFLGGLFAGLAYTEVRVLRVHKVHKSLIILVFSAFSCITLFPFVLLDYTPMSPAQLRYLLLAGITATGGQFGITAAYSHASAAEISVYDYSQVLFAAFLGNFLFQQTPDGCSILGYGIICGSAVAMSVYNSRRQLCGKAM